MATAKHPSAWPEDGRREPQHQEVSRLLFVKAAPEVPLPRGSLVLDLDLLGKLNLHPALHPPSPQSFTD
jgi:hypothetical protein